MKTKQLEWDGALPRSDASIPVKQGDRQGPDKVEDRLVERGTSGLGRMGPSAPGGCVCRGVLNKLVPEGEEVPAALSQGHLCHSDVLAGRGSEGRGCGIELCGVRRE